jgi:hypothetical protein
MTVFTAAEAAQVVTTQIDRFRNALRVEASHTDAFEQPRRRAELVDQIDLLNLLDETIRAALEAPSRVGPPLPEAAAETPFLRSPANLSAAQVAARWTPDGDR